MRIYIDDEEDVITCKISNKKNRLCKTYKGYLYFNCTPETRKQAKDLLFKVIQKL